jgi:hypothetical protein
MERKMKKWVDRKWEELRAGDMIRWRTGEYGYLWSNARYIEHIGSLYAKLTGSDYLHDSRFNFGKYQRFEEVEPPDGWYLVECYDSEVCWYKNHGYLYPSKRRVDGTPVERCNILKRVEFKDLE